MTIQEYKDRTGLTVRQLTEELKTVDPRINYPDVSRMLTGVFEPSAVIRSYINKKAVATSPNSRNEEEWATISLEEKIVLNRRFLEVYKIISAHNRDNPATYPEMIRKTGKKRREIQSLISVMRLKGVPITSYTGHEGFWLARDEQDMRNLIGMYEKQAKSSWMIASKLKQSCGGQLTWADTQLSQKTYTVTGASES